ncbi:hypothetical protein B566_EDAN016273 [Ephemera danica]|nr:hypothetical protein B566_EDAN016273 [Ephemera danica]
MKMPHFQLVTNVPADKIPKNFLTDTTALIAKILGKPQNQFVVVVPLRNSPSHHAIVPHLNESLYHVSLVNTMFSNVNHFDLE